MKQIKYVCPICGYTWNSSKNWSEEIQTCNNCGKIDVLPYSLDLLYYDIQDIIDFLKSELKRREKKEKVSIRYLWTTRENNKIYIDEMTKKHVENTIKMLERKLEKFYKEVDYSIF